MKVFFLVFALVAIAIVFLIIQRPNACNNRNGSTLTLYHGVDGTVLLRYALEEGETFAVSFIHSVNQSLVSEQYRIHNGQIVLHALDFYAFGAGMPTETEPGQTLIFKPEGGMRIEGFDRVLFDLVYVVGYATEHTLYVGDAVVALNELAEAGQPIRFVYG
jgi:hypothetical protein